METKIQIFSSPQFGEIRISLSASNEPLFCLADVCKILKLGNPSQVRTTLKQDGVISNEVGVQTGVKSDGTPSLQVVPLNFITEPNLYKCIFQSRKKEAEQFQDWVCEEVLPSIRKNGGYIAASPEETPEQIMARALIVAQSTIERQKQEAERWKQTAHHQEQIIQQSAPTIEYAEKVLQSRSTYVTDQVAKELNTTDISLNKKLKELGVIIRRNDQWVLTAKHIGKGYTDTRTHLFTHKDGSQGTSTHTVWTEKGRKFIHSMIEAANAANKTLHTVIRESKMNQQPQTV